MSRRHRRKNKNEAGTLIFLSLVIVACVVVILGFSVYSPGTLGLSDKLGTLIAESPFSDLAGSVKTAVTEKVTEQVTEQILEKTVQEALESSGESEAAAKAKKIVKNMDEEDKQTAEEIIGKYADGDTISDCLDILGDGVDSQSIAEVEQYLKDTISSEDVSALKDLYGKYGRQ
jgi:hypothetical protein